MRTAASLLPCLLLLLAGACAPPTVFVEEAEERWLEAAPPPDSTRRFRVFLIGDAGAASGDGPVMRLLQTQLEETGTDGAVVFLGDNLYPRGLPPLTHPARPEAEARLLALLQTVENYPGRLFFIPGDRDANESDPGSTPERSRNERAALLRQEAFIEDYLDRGNVFLPDDGFPGPAPVPLTDDLTLVALNTQWWLSDEQPYGDTGDYDLREPEDVLLELEDVLYQHRKKLVLVVGHHPLFSNGPYGGHFARWDHLTPFPVVGSIRPLYRRFMGSRQDLAHPRYRLFRREMLKLFDGREDLIYASAHDRSLQYFRKQERRRTRHYIVSGAAGEADFVAQGRDAAFTAGAEGFVSLQFYQDHSIWLEAWAPADSGRAGRLLFRHRLQGSTLLRPEPPAPGAAPDYRDSIVVRAANPGYDRIGKLGTLLAGSHHRALWATPVAAPVLDVTHTAGGLLPLRLGGQSQSVVLRLRGADGRTYMLRSIDKMLGRRGSPPLQRSVAASVLQEPVAMLHPFGALAVPPLADAVGVYHTNPRLFFVPNDPRLGIAREVLGGQLAMLEERADENMSDVASVGHARNVIGTTKLLEEITGDNDHRVDARAFARARLFDMLIADHDRTADNWRWSAFEPYEWNPALQGEARKKGKVYLPVPVDRDAAFMQVDGLLPNLYRRLFQPGWQDFDFDYGSLRGLNRKGLSLDRRLTASLTRQDWAEIADSIRLALTDEVIEGAVRSWPAPIYEQVGAQTIAKLEARRDRLPDVADAYYEVLADVVDVVGSHKHEHFVVRRLPTGATEVVVYKTSNEGLRMKTLFRRTFDPEETDEIRLYGMDGRDRFSFTGQVDRGIRVIVVGGPDDDTLVDSSYVAGRRRLTWFYDVPAGTQVNAGAETRLHLNEDPEMNEYVLEGYAYDTARPIGFFGSNDDDGLFIGGGVQLTRHGFRKKPYAALHQIMGNFAARTGAFNLRYHGHYPARLGPLDVNLDVGVFSPNNVRNFYGLGNETRRERDARFYQARLAQVRVRAVLGQTFRRGLRARFGPTYEYTNVRPDEDRFAIQVQPGITPYTFGRLFFAGLDADLTLSTIDHPANPTQGFRLTGEADFNVDVQHRTEHYVTFSSEAALFLSPFLSPQVTFANRIGAAHNLGTFPFFAANTIGGAENLRGFRNNRFAGRSAAYHNFDLRVELFDVGRSFGRMESGLLVFVDNGRVWTDGEDSRRWHTGYGAGAWVYLFRRTAVTATCGLSHDERTFAVQLGFFF